MAMPKSSNAIVEVATGTAIKTVLQVATPSTTDIELVAWGVSFDGTVSTNPAGVVTLADYDVAATVTSLTPEKYGSEFDQSSLCVGGTSATGYNASAEGSITASILRDGQNVHPQGAYSLWWPENDRPKIKVSKFLRIRCLFSVDVNCIPWIIWKEPA
jgi:hypothetical protein